MPLIELELERDGLLEMDLLGNFIGSAYAPQVDVTETDTGHEVAITYDDASTGITTKSFDVADGADGADGFSPTATVTQLADGATIRITDKDGTTTATVHDGTDGTDGADGFSPTARVTQTATGATISITDKQGTTTATVSNGADGSDGADGFSPTVDVQPIEGGHEVTITDAQGPHSFDVMDGDPAEPGSITDEMLASDGIKAQVAQLWGNQLKGTLTGDILTTTDAYAAPPMALTVDGRSTQAGTPTPDTPVPIESVEGVELHASADGTTDYGGWPVTLYDGTLRSLPDGTKDTLSLSYLRPSTTAGWAVYSRELVQRVFVTTYDGIDEAWKHNYGTVHYRTSNALRTMTNGRIEFMCDKLAGSETRSLAGARNSPPNSILGRAGEKDVVVRTEQIFESATDFSAWLAENPITVHFPLATPITTQLDPIELPVLPAPTATVYSDPTTGLTMEYVRDTNIVIASLQAALADLATS